MSSVLSALAAHLRTIVSPGARITWRDGSTVQVTTRHGRVAEGAEQFPYGFAAKGNDGTVLVLFEGGDVRRPVIMPVSSSDGAPDLNDGDAALWSKNGGWVVVRSDGTTELAGKSYGGLIKIEALTQELQKNSTILQAILTVVSTPVNEPDTGNPSAFQTAFAASLAGQTPGSWDAIENEKVLHGDGTA